MKLEAWWVVVCIEEDRIILHGIVHSRLIVELNFEVVHRSKVMAAILS
jgi:hypothetical protein